MLRTTFAAPAEAERSEWAMVAGQWIGTDDELVLAPRISPPNPGALLLFGAVPRGPREGVLTLSREPDGTWTGKYISAATLSEKEAVAQVTSDGYLDLQVVQMPTQRFRRIGPINMALLASINIIGHRGLSLGRSALMNSVRGVKLCWLFGCSGIEIDVAVPNNRDGYPLPAEMRVFHPREWRSEVTGKDAVSLRDLANAASLQDVLRASAEAGMNFVYIDSKLRWLVRNHPVAANKALEHIVATAKSHLTTRTGQTIGIGTETSDAGEAADIVTDMRTRVSWPQDLIWALEITRGTNITNAHARMRNTERAQRPDMMSFNLLRVRGGGGGVLRWFLPPMPDAQEQAFAVLRQPVIYWTAGDDFQFEGALLALERMGRDQFREAGIITPHPHRLAFYLATRPTR